MKHLKSLLVVFIILLLAFSICGCGPVTDSVNEEEYYNDGFVTDDQGVPEANTGDATWDPAKMHGLDAPKATITSLETYDGWCVYKFSDMELEDFYSYADKLVAAGYTYGAQADVNRMYVAMDSQGKYVEFFYNTLDKTGSVSSYKMDAPGPEQNNAGALPSYKELTWISVQVGGIPEPDCVLYETNQDEFGMRYYFELNGSFEEFVTVIQNAGFTSNKNYYSDEVLTGYTADNGSYNIVFESGYYDTENPCLLFYSKIE
jgi:hypothetical protein